MRGDNMVKKRFWNSEGKAQENSNTSEPVKPGE